jgi:hypothetical protein
LLCLHIVRIDNWLQLGRFRFMKVIVLYRANSEHERSVIDYKRDYKQRCGRDLNIMDIDTQEGSDMAELYDIVQYPAVVAASDNGELLQLWQGEFLPLIGDVMYYDNPAQKS